MPRTAVEADNDFECAAVLQQHSQDVKFVAWHPHDEVVSDRVTGGRDDARAGRKVHGRAGR